jgi:hypothetical protein
MKKIIALAVAGAFVAPAMAVEVNISGEVETTYTSSDGTANMSQGTQDIKVSFSDTLANGMTVSGYVLNDSANGTVTQDSALTISGDFGSFQIGKDAGKGGDQFDDVSDVASGGSGADAEIDDGVSTSASAMYTPNLGVDGLTATIGYASASTGSNTEVLGYGLKYDTGVVSLAYGAMDSDDSTLKTATIASATMKMGPVFVGVDSSSKIAGVDGDDSVAIGVTYTMGDIIFAYETMTIEDDSNLDSTDTVFDITYNVGAGLQVYVSADKNETATSSAVTAVDSTILGVEYKF